MEDSELEKLLKLSKEELKKELMKFSPKRRIEILNLIEEHNKKDQEERESLKDEAIREISLEEKFDEPPEQRTSPDLREEESLEQQVESVKTDSETSQEGSYKVGNLYSELRDIVQGEDRSYESLYRAGEIYDEIMQNKSYKPQEEIKDIAYASRKLMKDLMGEYVSNTYKD